MTPEESAHLDAIERRAAAYTLAARMVAVLDLFARLTPRALFAYAEDQGITGERFGTRRTLVAELATFLLGVPLDQDGPRRLVCRTDQSVAVLIPQDLDPVFELWNTGQAPAVCYRNHPTPYTGPLGG